MITTVLAFVLTLGVLIVIHEYGHYRVAVACGVKVLRFSVGFGRVLWRRQATPDSTEFVVCALPLGGYVRMLDEREGRGRARASCDRAFNRKPLLAARRDRRGRAARQPAARGAALCGRALDRHRRAEGACSGRRSAGSLAERAGLRAGDWVRACVERRRRLAGRALDDRPALAGRRRRCCAASALHLLVTDRDGRGQRSVALDLDALGATRGRRQADAAHRPRQRLQRAGARRGQGRRRRRRAPACAPATACCSIDGAPIADALAVARPDPRQRRAAARRRPCVARRARRRSALDVDGARRRSSPTATRSVGRIERVAGPAAGDGDGALRPVDGLAQGAVADLGDVGADRCKMLGKMVIGEASLKNLSGPLTIADYAGPVGAPRAGLLPRLSRGRQRQPRRAQPAAAADARWRTPDVLSFRGCDGATGLRVVARAAAAWRGGHHADDDVPRPLQRRGPPAGPALTDPHAILPPARLRCARRSLSFALAAALHAGSAWAVEPFVAQGHPRRGPAAHRPRHRLRLAAVSHRRHLHRREGRRGAARAVRDRPVQGRAHRRSRATSSS